VDAFAVDAHGWVSWQATKTWRDSMDPEFAQKMARILDLLRSSTGGRARAVRR
jgi:hypothetical protein